MIFILHIFLLKKKATSVADMGLTPPPTMLRPQKNYGRDLSAYITCLFQKMYLYRVTIWICVLKTAFYSLTNLKVESVYVI